MSYYIQKTKSGYKVINLSTQKVERSFYINNIYNFVNDLLNDLYIQHGVYDYSSNMLIAPNKKFKVFLNEWVAINQLNNRHNLNINLRQVKSYPTLDEILS